MMRLLPFAALLLLGACASHVDTSLRDGQPGVSVADAALRGGSPQVALRIDKEILAKDPGNVPALLNRGEVLTAQQQYDEAAQSFTLALKSDPDSVQARIGLGRVRLASDPAAAERLFLEVLQQDPHNVIALNDLGIARDLQGRHREAQESYREAMGIDPSIVGVRVNLALSLAMMGRADDAAPMLRPIADAPSAPRKLRHDMAAVLAMGGDRAGAERILTKDMSPEQASQAVAIFTAASTSANPPGSLDTPAAGGAVMVRLGEAPSAATLMKRWEGLRARLPALLAHRDPTISPIDQSGRKLFELRTGGFASLSEAGAFCREISAAGGQCSLTGS